MDADAHAEFEALVAPYRRELLAHCYRMLGSLQDAEDALQEALLGAWRGLAGFEGRASPRAWLYRIATNACLRLGGRRPPRMRSMDHGPAWTDTADLGEPVAGPVWLEPWPETWSDPAASYERTEDVELAFVAALASLPASQRAVLVLREVLQFPAAEVAGMLEVSTAAVNSALQRARATVGERGAQRQELQALGPGGRRELVGALVRAWERADVDAIAALLTEDARFTMPPLPAWFDGREAVVRFLRERVMATPWRLRPAAANGQLALAAYQGLGGQPGAGFRLGAVNVLGLRGGRVAELAAFLDPAVHAGFGLPLALER